MTNLSFFIRDIFYYFIPDYRVIKCKLKAPLLPILGHICSKHLGKMICLLIL